MLLKELSRLRLSGAQRSTTTKTTITPGTYRVTTLPPCQSLRERKLSALKWRVVCSRSESCLVYRVTHIFHTLVERQAGREGVRGWSLSTTPGTELKKTNDPTENCQLIGLGEWVQKKYIYFFSLRHVNHYVGLPYHYFNSSNLSRIFDFEYSFGYLLYRVSQKRRPFLKDQKYS